VTGRISERQNKLFENSKVMNTWGGALIFVLCTNYQKSINYKTCS